MVAIGQNTVTSIARHFILPTITDNVYRSNILLYRLMKNNKKIVHGGTQIEVPLQWQRFNTGGAYSNYDVFNTTPSDTVRNAAFRWKQYYVTWSVSGLTMIQVDTPDAIANFLVLQSQQAYQEMAEFLATGVFAGTTGPAGVKELDGLADMLSLTNNYGDIPRTTNVWWQPYVQGGSGASATMGFPALQTMFTGPSVGGQHPTLFVSRQDQYNRYAALNAGTAGYSVQYNRAPEGNDEMLASAGFTNLLWNNVPWVTDSHVLDATTINASATASTSLVHAINENMISLVVTPRADFFVKPFQEPPNQDAMVSAILWGGNLICQNSATQGVVANFG